LVASEELRQVRGERALEAPPTGFEVDELIFPGGPEQLERAREVMIAVLTEQPLPAWFTAQCVDDGAVQTCTLDRWSLRAWKFWLQPENRRWWWWSADTAGGSIHLKALVRVKPYLRGSVEWLFKAAA
jgi:hypothetical protein